MINFDVVTKENIKKHNPNSPEILEYWNRIWIIGKCFGYGKTNSLFNVIFHQPDDDKIYLYTKDLFLRKISIFN